MAELSCGPSVRPLLLRRSFSRSRGRLARMVCTWTICAMEHTCPPCLPSPPFPCCCRRPCLHPLPRRRHPVLGGTRTRQVNAQHSLPIVSTAVQWYSDVQTRSCAARVGAIFSVRNTEYMRRNPQLTFSLSLFFFLFGRWGCFAHVPCVKATTAGWMMVMVFCADWALVPPCCMR